MSTYETGAPTAEGASSGDMKERAVETVAEVDAGAMYVAGVAGEEAAHVAHDAKSAARGFFEETKAQLADQASSQQRRAAGALRSTGDELTGLASGTATGSGGMATSAVRALGQHTARAADWLEQREPADVVYEVRSFARRHTGAFVLIAVGVGIVAGRVAKALMADARDSGRARTAGAALSRPAATVAGTTGVGSGAGTAGGTGAGVAGGTGAGVAGGTGASGGVGTADGMGGAGSTGTTGGTGATIGNAGATEGAAGHADVTAVGDTPIGDTLSDEHGLSSDESASGEWSPSGEAQR